MHNSELEMAVRSHAYLPCYRPMTTLRGQIGFVDIPNDEHDWTRTFLVGKKVVYYVRGPKDTPHVGQDVSDGWSGAGEKQTGSRIVI